MDTVVTLLQNTRCSYISFVVKMGSTLNQQRCLVGAYCGYAILIARANFMVLEVDAV